MSVGDTGLTGVYAALDGRNRFGFLNRIQTAVRPETRARRIEHLTDALAQGRTPYPAPRKKSATELWLVRVKRPEAGQCRAVGQRSRRHSPFLRRKESTAGAAATIHSSLVVHSACIS